MGCKPSGLAEQPAVVRVSDNRLLAALPEDCLALLEPDLKEVALDQGTVCYEAGNPIEQIYFPQTGMISLLITVGNGETVEVASIGREGAAGLQSGLGSRSSFTRAIVQIGGRFSVISASLFKQAVSGSAALRELVQRHTETLLAEAQQNAACNAIHDGSSRLCRWLLQCADRALQRGEAALRHPGRADAELGRAAAAGGDGLDHQRHVDAGSEA